MIRVKLFIWKTFITRINDSYWFRQISNLFPIIFYTQSIRYFNDSFLSYIFVCVIDALILKGAVLEKFPDRLPVSDFNNGK